MLNRTLESYAIAHDPDFIPHELLHLAHQLFESGVDGPIRISYARLAPGLGWTMAKFVAHFPAGPGTKDQTLEQGILARRFAPCTPVVAASPAAYSAGRLVRPCRSVRTPPMA